MDRVYNGSARRGYTNPDYALENLRQDGHYQDNLKHQAYAYDHAVPEQAFEDEQEEVDTPFEGSRGRSAWKTFFLYTGRLVLTTLTFGILLLIPMIVTWSYKYSQSEVDSDQDKNFVFWLFAWLIVTYACGVIAWSFGLIFPYIFYGFATWINPAHRRYWRVFVPLKKPFAFLVVVVVGWSYFYDYIENNASLTYMRVAYEQVNGVDIYGNPVDNSNPQAAKTDRVFFATATTWIDNILVNAILWAVAYLFERILIIYISIHYHYRSGYGRIEKSKALIQALVTAYDLSVKLDPLYCDKFQDQDLIIRAAVAAASRRKRGPLKFFQKIGGASGKVLSAFGTMMGASGKSHWLKAGSTYAVVEHALEKPESARALAQRIWASLVPVGQDTLTQEHIAELLRVDQKDEAETCFKAIDENQNGDVRITEFEPMLVEAGKMRSNIYTNMAQIDHAINTFDWILLIWIAAFIVFINLFSFLPIIKDLKDLFGFVGLGLGVAASGIVREFFLGSVFIFFKHPYDVGDRVDLFNAGEGNSVGCVVKRISLLYCVFERTDTGVSLQFPNAKLWDKRVENHTRSGLGTEKFTLNLHITTSFKDLESLRNGVKEFLAAPENSRDYRPNVALRVKSIHDLDKMEVAMVITHKANWSNDGLKSARSSRVYCALIDIARRIPLTKPGAITTLGDEGKPNYMVVVSEEEAAAKRAAETLKLKKKRHDFDMEAEELSGDAKAAKAAEDKEKEVNAYKDISSIPATMAGRGVERPVYPAEATTTSTQYHDGQNQGSRQRPPSRSFTSEHSPLYDTGYAYQGAGQGTPSAPQQTYQTPRTSGNRGYDGSRAHKG